MAAYLLDIISSFFRCLTVVISFDTFVFNIATSTWRQLVNVGKPAGDWLAECDVSAFDEMLLFGGYQLYSGNHVKFCADSRGLGSIMDL